MVRLIVQQLILVLYNCAFGGKNVHLNKYWSRFTYSVIDVHLPKKGFTGRRKNGANKLNIHL